MTIPTLLTASRILLTPVFLSVFWLSANTYQEPVSSLSLIALLVLYFILEITDFLDGALARAMNQVTDLGKIMDPFADSLARITYFLCFVLFLNMPFWIFAIILYRDMGVAFGRQLMAKSGTSMGARISGKIKAWIYAIAGILGILYFFSLKTGLLGEYWELFGNITLVSYYLCALTAIWTGIDYFISIRKSLKSI